MLRFLRPLVVIAVLAGLAAYATIMLRGPQGLRALQEKRQQIRTLEEENANLARDIEAKKQRIERLKNDPGTQRVAVQQGLGKLPQGATEFKVSGQHVGPPPPKPEGGSSTEDPQ